ncbi:cyclopropane-fatty-acyl-phospholipid synthase [Desarmillaria tabescens]|uniref:Cyclopropane-fatty-acyl-phospholipid synthase n=1 Tax=Armillaria tabescens TaxID=1929756 RepID=A0AA39NLD4_ARMTA|nr:cyclopropane-fatty-acyl-phospholipid synthase [Desarmillaria tabescens]KAK0467776.1 cyclopropane-fatty-acyl-phospholipid synthase [Desarmillaria tabescens]
MASKSCIQFSSESAISPLGALALFSPRSWLASFARQSILSTLSSSIAVGYLVVDDAEGSHTYGTLKKGCNYVHIKVKCDNFWLRLILSGDLGFSEAYMIGEIELPDLRAAMNTKSNARLNVIASYDQSNELFKAFLSSEMMYSCALWDESEGGVRGDLEISGEKLHHVLRQARLKPGYRVLEFGSGWGGLAIEAASTFGCTVDTLTLSIEQKTLAEERIAAAGLSDKIRVHLLDYRDIPSEWENAFDAFVSVEMLEHVGSKHYSNYFRLVSFALKPHNATAVVSASTFPESRYSSYQAEDFMRKYMWPNSCLPSASALIQAASPHFNLERVENHAAHYPRTLREWGRRLEKNLTQEMVAKDYAGLNDKQSYEAFKRKWMYLFAYAGAGFAKGYITCHMLTFIRENDAPEICD